MKIYALILSLVVLLTSGNESSANSSLAPNASGIKSIIAQQLNIPEVKIHNSDTLASLSADDLDLFEIIITVEDTYDISIIDEALIKEAGATRSNELINKLSIANFIQVASTSKKHVSEPNSQLKNKSKPLVGTYIELITSGIPQDHVIVFIPSLSTILISIENNKGKPLTKEEVINIRNNSAVITLPTLSAKEMIKSRGYYDINPNKCWEEWQQMRNDLIQN